MAGLVLGMASCGPPVGSPGAPEAPGAAAPPAAPATKPYPPTEILDVVDTYHGVSVTDPYRYLERWDDPKVKAWSKSQNDYARSVLDVLPHVGKVRARLTHLLGNQSPRYFSLTRQGGTLFAMKEQPPKQQPFLIALPSADAPEKARVVVDPNVLDAKGTTTIDWYFPSDDGKLVAVSLSKEGSEAGDLHVYDVETGEQKYEVIPRVNGGTAGGTLAWDPDGKGFCYSRYPRKGERPEKDMAFYVQVYHHRLGTSPSEDTYEIGKDFPRIAEIELKSNPETGHLLANVQNGDGGEFALYLRERGTWKQLSKFEDRVLQAEFGPDDALYLLSRNGAPRGKVQRMPLNRLDLAKAETVIPEGPDTIVNSFWDAPSVLPTDNRLYVLYQLGGPSEFRVFDLKGKPQSAPKQLPVAAAHGIVPLGGDDVLFSNWSFVQPPAVYRYDAKSGATTKTALASTSPADMSKVKVVREMATSKDGTKVPVNILLPAGHEKGKAIPCVVNGYGGYGVSLAPRFRAYYNVLLEQGVCYAVANIRGGGEFGEAWHKAGNLTNKQNVFDDFAAVLKHLVDSGTARRDALGIIGGSNGGLLMGSVLTQHPGMVKVVVSFVGIYDMLRVENSPNGAFNVTEFGTVKDRAQFEALHAYSPYHRVVDGADYPATLMLTGENDPRVDPMQSRKMIARLQAATSSNRPLLLRTSSDSGHGGGHSLEQEIAQLTDVYAFIFDRLGVEVR